MAGIFVAEQVESLRRRELTLDVLAVDGARLRASTWRDSVGCAGR